MTSQTRREFLASATALTAAAALPFGGAPAEARAGSSGAHPADPGWIAGDPYTASAEAGGFGRRSFDAARDHALRFRTPACDRDRLVLGLEG